MSSKETSISLGMKLATIINKIRKENNITYRQMCLMLKNNGYEIQEANLRRLGTGVASSLPVYVANALAKTFDNTISSSELLNAMGLEFIVDDNLSDEEKALIMHIRAYPAETQRTLIESLKLAINNFVKVVT
tara:strand:- start:582 stop:980 length:399 start_codon:yes stop_codon:yes gene_type:complete